MTLKIKKDKVIFVKTNTKIAILNLIGWCQIYVFQNPTIKNWFIIIKWKYFIINKIILLIFIIFLLLLILITFIY
jgi:hypothetical protein